MFPFARSSQGVAVAAGEFTPGGGWYSSSAGRRWCCGNIVMDGAVEISSWFV